MITVAVANGKGGVGKTTTAATLAYLLASEHGRRVALVDADPQSSLTAISGVQDAGTRNLADVLGDAEPGKLAMGDILHELPAGVWLAPASDRLNRSEVGLVVRVGREMVLRRALATIAPRFDVALIDCPSSGLLQVLALTAARGVICPVIPEQQALAALRRFLLHDIPQVQEALNERLEVVGILATMYDARTLHHRQALAALQAGQWRVFPPVGRSVRVAEAAAGHETIISYDPRNKRADEYREVGKAINQWLNDALK